MYSASRADQLGEAGEQRLSVKGGPCLGDAKSITFTTGLRVSASPAVYRLRSRLDMPLVWALRDAPPGRRCRKSSSRAGGVQETFSVSRERVDGTP